MSNIRRGSPPSRSRAHLLAYAAYTAPASAVGMQVGRVGSGRIRLNNRVRSPEYCPEGERFLGRSTLSRGEIDEAADRNVRRGDVIGDRDAGWIHAGGAARSAAIEAGGGGRS